MEHLHHFKRSLVRMLQSGVFARILGCDNERQAQIIFELQRRYHVHYTRRYIVLHECEREIIHQRTNGRWRRQRPMMVDRGRLVIDRASGQIVPTRDEPLVWQ